MGAIYLATDHETFERTVVIKAMLDYFDPSNPQEVQAARNHFEHEARTLAELRHSAIPQIYTHFQETSYNYIVMEYIEGRNLEQGLTHTDEATGKISKGSPYPKQEVIRWGVALCKVLEYLASRKPHPVVHHDIKPANILLDSNSNEIRLVDFGTAKARLMVQAGGGSVGLQKSSIFGTQGYAPPEQYRGESEPRSDVYALAATLYHLAVDDDPGLHPFSFPHLTQLGAFGEVLQVALDREVCKRPTATQLRHQLETLLTPVRPIQAPDGTEMTRVPELVQWCESHWEQAARWLYQSLPDMVEHLWFQPEIAQHLRDVVRAHRNRNAGLDAALAMLDPQGFGTAQPTLAVDAALVDFGRVARQDEPTAALMLKNTGRRFLRVQAEELPDWLHTRYTTLPLPPGKEQAFPLMVKLDQTMGWGRHQDKLLLHDGTHGLLQVGVQTKISPWRTLKHHLTVASNQKWSLFRAIPLMLLGGGGGWYIGFATLYPGAYVGFFALVGAVLMGILDALRLPQPSPTKDVVDRVLPYGVFGGLLGFGASFFAHAWFLSSTTSTVMVPSEIGALLIIVAIVGTVLGVFMGILGGLVAVMLRVVIGLFRR
jgi:serine/threonine protein kinase